MRFQLLNMLMYAFQDVDECERQNGGCEHSCVNEVGSYHCACRDGYTLADDRHMCNGNIHYLWLGIFTTACSHVMSISLSVCSLSLHFSISNLLHFAITFSTLSDIDECSAQGEGPCQQVCTNLPGTHLCSCHSGFNLEEDGLSCMAAIHNASGQLLQTPVSGCD